MRSRGYITFHRDVLSEVRRRATEHKGRGRPRDKARLVLLIEEMAINADFIDIPEKGRKAGCWYTSYPEIEAELGLSKSATERALKHLQNVGLINKQPTFPCFGHDTVANEGAYTLPKGICIEVLFYQALTDTSRVMRRHRNGHNAAVKPKKQKKRSTENRRRSSVTQHLGDSVAESRLRKRPREPVEAAEAGREGALPDPDVEPYLKALADAGIDDARDTTRTRLMFVARGEASLPEFEKPTLMAIRALADKGEWGETEILERAAQLARSKDWSQEAGQKSASAT